MRIIFLEAGIISFVAGVLGYLIGTGATKILAPYFGTSHFVWTAQIAAVPVQHVVQYVQLLPGQTPPPNATVSQAAPAPTPRVVVVTTRQSGTKR